MCSTSKALATYSTFFRYQRWAILFFSHALQGYNQIFLQGAWFSVQSQSMLRFGAHWPLSKQKNAAPFQMGLALQAQGDGHGQGCGSSTHPLTGRWCMAAGLRQLTPESRTECGTPVERPSQCHREKCRTSAITARTPPQPCMSNRAHQSNSKDCLYTVHQLYKLCIKLHIAQSMILCLLYVCISQLYKRYTQPSHVMQRKHKEKHG